MQTCLSIESTRNSPALASFLRLQECRAALKRAESTRGLILLMIAFFIGGEVTCRVVGGIGGPATFLLWRIPLWFLSTFGMALVFLFFDFEVHFR